MSVHKYTVGVEQEGSKKYSNGQARNSDNSFTNYITFPLCTRQVIIINQRLNDLIEETDGFHQWYSF